MPQAIIGVGAVVVIIAVMVTLTRRTRQRMREVMAAENETTVAPPPLRGKKALADLTPAKPRPTIQDLVDEEAAATGVNDIPGGEDLNVSLKLRVFWRDEVVRKGCNNGRLEFRIDSGVDLDSIRTEDVRLVCVQSDSASTPADGAPTDPTPSE